MNESVKLSVSPRTS